MSWLERIREKSEGTRVRYLFSAVGVSFLFVLVVWFFSLKTSVLGVSDVGSNEGFDSIRQFREEVGPPPSLDGLLQAGESLQGVDPSSGEGVAAPSEEARLDAGSDASLQREPLPSEELPIDAEGGY